MELSFCNLVEIMPQFSGYEEIILFWPLFPLIGVVQRLKYEIVLNVWSDLKFLSQNQISNTNGE